MNEGFFTGGLIVWGMAFGWVGLPPRIIGELWGSGRVFSSPELTTTYSPCTEQPTCAFASSHE
jgi:hypothetical protein